ncbi:putative pentatricopeptide repeat-containing protein At5g43820 [Typha angustifolia]|uniref:putative pentatricopeptide repeat-containing protein At5g43820 n=1 Tax=Typha angustifolia TaxID=59011 RepID=UPI003C2BA5B1
MTCNFRVFGIVINRSVSCFISLPFLTWRFRPDCVVISPCFHSLERVQSRANSTSSYHQQKKKYQVTDFYLKPEEEVYAREIRRVILKGPNGTVEDVIQSLKSDQFCPRIQITPQLVDSLLQKFGDDWKSASGFFEWVRLQFDYKHTPYACNKLVDLLGKMKQMDRMWDLVHNMHHEGSVTLETIAKIMRRLAGARRWKDAIALFDNLESMGFERDTESMNLLLDTLCKEKKVEVAHEAYQVIKDHIPPDAYTFNIFVHGWCSARRIDEAMWTIQEMRGRGFKPSVITYSTVLQAYCNQGNFRKVYELLDLMVSEGCPPNVVTYTTIMNSLAKSGKLDEALGITQRMKSSGCDLDTLFYNSLINILGRAGQLHEASQIFETLYALYLIQKGENIGNELHRTVETSHYFQGGSSVGGKQSVCSSWW